MAAMVPLTLASVYGLQVSIATSAAAEQRQRLEVTLATVTEDLKSVPYLPCGSAQEYQELYRSWSEPLSAKVRATEVEPKAAISDVTYWNRGKDAYTSSCGGDDGAQRLTVMVTDGELTADGSLVKRDAAARVGNSG